MIAAQDAAPDGAWKSALPSFPTACAVGHRMTPAKAGFAVVPGPYFNAYGVTPAPQPSPRTSPQLGLLSFIGQGMMAGARKTGGKL